MSLMRSFMRNCWLLWRRPAALLWSDESTHTWHLHVHTDYVTFYIYAHTQTEYQVYTKYTEQPSITRTHSVLPPLHLPVSWRLKEEAQRGGGKKKKKKRTLNFFKCFEEAFLSFSFNKLWCHSSECLTTTAKSRDEISQSRTSLETEKSDLRRKRQSLVVFLPDELIDWLVFMLRV